MKLDFDSFPLNIYDQPSSRSILKSVRDYVPDCKLANFNLGKSILSYMVKKITGFGMAFALDSLAIWYYGRKARSCLLFSNTQYKSLNDNLTHRLGLITEGRWMDKKMYEPFDIYDPFVKRREEANAEYLESLSSNLS